VEELLRYQPPTLEASRYDEILQRFPEWEVDVANASMDSSQVRGWSSLPVHLPTGERDRRCLPT